MIGSVAKPLWKEVPRFSEFRRERGEIWHECGDLDLALWIDLQDRLGALRRSAVMALRAAYEKGTGISVANHRLDFFLIEPDANRYLGRLCSFDACAKEKRDCLMPGCGAAPFNKKVAGFIPDADFLAPTHHGLLYVRGVDQVRSALDLPQPDG